MASSKILLVEDDADMAEMVSQVLEGEGFDVTWAKDGRDGLQKCQESRPRLVLLDLSLPEMGGHDVCRNLRECAETRTLPIVMLTGRIDEAEVVKGLSLGADDYVMKPFRPKELVARIHALLRRSEAIPVTSATASFGPISMDAEKFETKAAEQVVSLTRAEFRLLWTLLTAPGKVFTRDQLLEKIAGSDATVVDRNVDVHIGAVRRKLGTCGGLILTVRGIGYKLSDEAVT